MSIESNATDIANDEEQSADANKEQVVQTGSSLEDQLKYLKEINADLIKTRDAAKRKTREYEKEVETHKTLAANLKEKLVSKIVTNSLKEALSKAGALSVDTALKLIDKSKITLNDDFEYDTNSITSLVEELRKSDSVLFKPEAATDEKEVLPVKHTSVGRAGEAENAGTAFQLAIANAKSQKQIDAIMQQFGKI